MNYEIIFYHSGKTAEAEQLLDLRLSRLGLERSDSSAATEPAELPAMLQQSLCRAELIFTVGGLDGSKNSTEELLSQALSSVSGKISSQKLIDEYDNPAYLISSGRQMIIVLPDDTAVIETMLEKKLLSELEAFYSLKSRKDERPPIEQITKELDRQLASMPRRPAGLIAPPVLSFDRTEKRMKLIAAILGAAALVQAVLAVVFLTI